MDKTAVITKENGEFIRFCWRQQRNGLYSTTTSHYDADGYYNAGNSSDRLNVTLEMIDKALDAARSLFSEVAIY